MIMENKLVSAIITTHNRKKLLNRAINSVFAQTYSPIELIVVDDNSEDGTSEICQNQGVKYIYIPKEESRGGNYARNLGIKVSNGKYCAFLDDDDYWLPTKIEKQMSLICEENCGMVYCGRLMEYITDGETEFQELLPPGNAFGDMSNKVLQVICATTSCILAKKETLFQVGLFDEALCFWQEYELTIRLAQITPFYFVNEALCVYRVDTNDSNRLTNKFDGWKRAVKYIYEKHSNLFQRLNWLEKEFVKMNYYADAANRSMSCGMTTRADYYKILFWTRFLPARIVNKFLKRQK